MRLSELAEEDAFGLSRGCGGGRVNIASEDREDEAEALRGRDESAIKFSDGAGKSRVQTEDPSAPCNGTAHGSGL